MKTKDLVIYCLFVAGTALMYGTKQDVETAAANIAGAKVERVDSFSDMI